MEQQKNTNEMKINEFLLPFDKVFLEFFPREKRHRFHRRGRFLRCPDTVLQCHEVYRSRSLSLSQDLRNYSAYLTAEIRKNEYEGNLGG